MCCEQLELPPADSQWQKRPQHRRCVGILRGLYIISFHPDQGRVVIHYQSSRNACLRTYACGVCMRECNVVLRVCRGRSHKLDPSIKVGPRPFFIIRSRKAKLFLLVITNPPEGTCEQCPKASNVNWNKRDQKVHISIFFKDLHGLLSVANPLRKYRWEIHLY